MRRLLPRLGLSIALLVAPSACTGVLNNDASGEGSPSAGSANGPGTPGAPGSAGATMTGTAGSGGGAAAADIEDRVMRRLNHADYNNTVRDLLGTSLRPADKLPDDETAENFDTIGEVLSLSPSHFETLEQAAGQLIDELYALPPADARRGAVLVCQLQTGAEATCARQILSGFARRAYRRPVTDAEVSSLLQLVDKVRAAGESYEGALKAALKAILVSPSFLYMVEKSPGGAGVVAPVSDHELATRLSYFLWSSMPDAALFAAADAGELTRDPAKLSAQVARMLQDPKAEALLHDFGGQWLPLRRLDLVDPDPQTFPKYDQALRDAAVQETEKLFQTLISDNAGVETLLTANFTFVNQRLAQHYGLSATGTDFQRADLSQSPRVGILSQASFLMATSHPAFTSPTKRGVWVLEQLLCSPPPPLPPDLNIQPLTAPVEGETLREKLEQHRKNQPCAGCHAVMDPIGLGLENFDAVGGYRTMENGKPIDASGVLNGKSFSGVRELSALLSPDPRLQTCFVRQLLTYAVGRSFSTAGGQSYVDSLVQSTGAAGHKGLRDMIAAVTQSDAFRTRRGE